MLIKARGKINLHEADLLIV